MTVSSGNSVVCPHCGHEHGDAWEWCADTSPQTATCDECGARFQCWAEYDVRYHSEPIEQESL